MTKNGMKVRTFNGRFLDYSENYQFLYYATHDEHIHVEEVFPYNFPYCVYSTMLLLYRLVNLTSCTSICLLQRSKILKKRMHRFRILESGFATQANTVCMCVLFHLATPSPTPSLTLYSLLTSSYSTCSQVSGAQFSNLG
jgi:hypothetical protein